MTDLSTVFKQAVSEARQRLDLSMAIEGLRPTLWRVIAGPPGSGKSTLAREYAEALKAEGLANTVHEPELRNANFIGQAKKMLDDTEGGVVIIDEPYTLHDDARQSLERHMLKAYDERSCIIVMTGYKERMEQYMEGLPEILKRRWQPDIIETERSFTRSERETHAQARLAALAFAQRQKEHDTRVNEWKNLPAVEVAVTKAIKPLRTPRFAKPERPA